MLWTYVLKLIVLLPLVCGLMIGSLYLWRKLETRMPGKPATRLIAVRETMMISPGLRLAVLDFEGKRLLVSVGRGGVNLIDKGAQGADEAPTPTPMGVTGFRQGLGQSLGLGR